MIENEFTNQKEVNIQTNQIKDTETIIQEENNKEKNSESDNKMDENSIGNNGRWAKNEHIRFLAGCLLYKNNWKKVETYVRTRTSTQIRSHAQKYLKKLEKKYFSKGFGNKSPNDSFNDEFDFALIKKEKNENINLVNNNESNKEKKEKENNTNQIELDELKDINNISDIPVMKIKDFQEGENKIKLSEEKIKQLVEDLNKENFDVEIVEKIIINIFRPNKKCEDLTKPEPKKQTQKINNTHIKTNKNIFLCQKQKREINYESNIKEKLESNNPSDLEYLFKIYRQRNSPEIDILVAFLNDNN